MAPQLGVKPLCEALGVSTATYYRRQLPNNVPKDRPTSHRALSLEEKQTILQLMNSERFQDMAPPQIYAALLDDGRYYCSEREMYRILTENKQVKERRDQRRHPVYTAPELIAKGPNEVWSWDVTKLPGMRPFEYFYLYVMIDIFSRYVVGWLLASCEAADYAERLIQECYDREEILPGQLTVHSDNGPIMIATKTTDLLRKLEAKISNSRPYVSNDNPFSESQFKTMKYRPDFPKKMGDIDVAREFCRGYFPWYNHEHHHSGLSMLTPHEVHSGTCRERVTARQRTLNMAYEAHPERFIRGCPVAKGVPNEVWINKPARAVLTLEANPRSVEVELQVASRAQLLH
jgi:putative transposase